MRKRLDETRKTAEYVRIQRRSRRETVRCIAVGRHQYAKDRTGTVQWPYTGIGSRASP